MTTMNLSDMFDTNGWYLEEVNGELRYVTRDEDNRAHVGPRRRRTRGLLSLFRRCNRRPSAAPQNDAEETVVLPTGDRVAALYAVPLVAPEGFRARWVRRLHEASWHRAVRHTAIDVAMWACMLALSAVCIKAALFVVML